MSDLNEGKKPATAEQKRKPVEVRTHPDEALLLSEASSVVGITSPDESEAAAAVRSVNPMYAIEDVPDPDDDSCLIEMSSPDESEHFAIFQRSRNPLRDLEAALPESNEDSNSSPEGSGVNIAGDRTPDTVPQRLWSACESGLRRIGLCPCVVHRCLGNTRTCRICRPSRRNQYSELEEEDYQPVDFGENAGDRYKHIILMRFYMGSPLVKTFHPLLVSKTMTAHDVVKGIAVIGNTSDHYRYAIVEYWREYEAERILDDHELMLNIRAEHVASLQHFLFVYQRNFDKYDFALKKSKYFINPTIARQKNLRKKKTEDPMLIQVQDLYFYNSNDVLDPPPSRLRALKELKPKEQKKIAEAARQESIPQELPLERTDSVEIEIEPMSSTVSTAGADESVLSDNNSSMPLLSSLLQKPSTSSESPEIPENDRVNPIYCGTIYAKTGNRDYTVDEVKAMPNQKEKVKWAKKYLLLRNRTLFFVKDHDAMLKFYFMEDSQFSRVLEKNERSSKSSRTLTFIGVMSEFEIYVGARARRYHNAPHGGSIYLRQRAGELRKPIKLMFCAKPLPNMVSTPDNLDLSIKGRNLWMTALRLAKHGVKVIEGHAVFMREQMEYNLRAQTNPAVLGKLKKDVHKKMGNMPAFKVSEKFERMNEERCSKRSLSDSWLPDWMEDPRVAMDFTEGTGRIIHDEAEIEQMRREPKQAYRFEKYENFPADALQHGPHLTQKYYHRNITRQEAEAKLLVAKKTGSWLLRDSHVRTNCLTLSYVHEGRIYHKYIAAASYRDSSSNSLLYVATLDQKVAFYDVHSLTEFYRLNKGETMLCMLGPSVKNADQPDGSPSRALVPVPSRSSTRPISLVPSTPKDTSEQEKSPRSLKDFFKKSGGKPKPAAKSTLSTIGAGPLYPTPSRDEVHGDYMTSKALSDFIAAEIRRPGRSVPSTSQESSKAGAESASSDPSPQV